MIRFQLQNGSSDDDDDDDGDGDDDDDDSSWQLLVEFSYISYIMLRLIPT